MCHSALCLTTVFLIKPALTEAIKESRDMYLRLLLMSCLTDEPIIITILSIRNDWLQNSSSKLSLAETQFAKILYALCERPFYDYFSYDYFSHFSHFRTLIWNTKTEKIANVTSKFLSHVRTRLLNMTWSNLRFNV